MQIKGCKKSVCSLCANAHFQSDNTSLVCMISKNDVQKNDSCKKFEYDIFKYAPENKIKDFKFTKEDFEI